MSWNKKSHEEIKQTVFQALETNVNYVEETVLGIPASYLDDKVFNQDESFLQNAPFISTLVKNPNHIGCHTLGKSESFFSGTQAIEKDVIDICSVDILKGQPGQQDGYVASGGTEANMQAIWVYRNYFMQVHGARLEEICILCSEDSHYSMDKASNILVLDIEKVQVDEENRSIDAHGVAEAVQRAGDRGAKYFIVVCNMMTTMFGSVDSVDAYVEVLEKTDCQFKVHIDGAFGGFYYPFTEGDSALTFENPHITSFTLDAHKMAQAPYGTGIFLIRKNHIHYTHTQEASYVEGEDCTMIGSRSGANAVAIWMILTMNGPYGWQEKIFVLQKRTEWMCKRLNQLGIPYYRNSRSNIITMKSAGIPADIAEKYGLVPDNHTTPNWYKIVIMEHVTIEKLMPLVEEISALHEPV
ncbi:MAG: aspartate aminotransferase family protein [Bacteroidia bacterium]|nr:aspartate aminotransferase family protein [Bacteroidia bacterium]